MGTILLGLRGSGKTTLGRALAEKRGVAFKDLDDYVRAGTGKSVAEVFRDGGEASFRRWETTSLLFALAGLEDGVLATGGGVVVQELNRHLLADQTHENIYLHAEPAVLLERIERDPASPSTRPPLTDLSPLEELEQLYAQRHGFYTALATRTLDASKDIQTLLVEIGDGRRSRGGRI